MYLKNKRLIGKLAALFFVGMVLFTLLSRAVYQNGVAVVSTAAPAGGTVAHTVTATGKIVQNQVLAVNTVAGLRVGSILVNEGQEVAQGDVLLTLDQEYLEEVILTQKQEMEKQKMNVQDAQSRNYASQKQRENAQAQAEENYDSAVAQAQTNLDRAQRDLERAEAALEDYYNGESSGQAEEEALAQACQEAEAAYNQAAAELEALEGEIEARIQEAIAQAEAEANEPTQPETTTPAETTAPAEPTQTTEPTEPGIVDPAEPIEPQELSVVGEALPRMLGLSQQERDAIAQQIREEYAQQLAQAQQKAELAKQAMDQAQADMDGFYQQQSQGDAASEEELLQAVENAQEAYEDALTALENAKTVYSRAVSSANLPSSSDHSAQIGQITYEQMELELEKLEALLEAEGKVLSPVDGIVTGCNVQTGGKTSDTAAMLLADLNQGLKFSCLITREQSEYIGVGDKVTLQASATGREYSDLAVTTLSSEEETEGFYRMMVQLPADTMTLGASAELTFTRKSQPYRCCVPLSALHLDSQNRTYVLVVDQVESVLGTQDQARKVIVTVLEQNETTAALDEGALTSEDQVIVGSDRPVDVGSRVRVG